MTKEAISKATGINRTSVLHHIKILQKRKLVKVAKPKKGEGAKGAPTIVKITDRADPVTKASLEMFENIAKLFKKKG